MLHDRYGNYGRLAVILRWHLANYQVGGWRLQDRTVSQGRNSKGVRKMGKDCIVLIWHTRSIVMDIDITQARYWSRQDRTALYCTDHSITSQNIKTSSLALSSLCISSWGVGRDRLLADEEHVDSAQIEVVVERERGEAIICRMLTGIKLAISIRPVVDRMTYRPLTITVFPLY